MSKLLTVAEYLDYERKRQAEEIPPRPLIDPHASALKQDKQYLAQQRWDKKYGGRE